MLRIAVFVLVIVTTAPATADDVRSGGPFVPTPQPVVDEMLNLARVGPEDFVIDLGSGDGRIVLTAASRYLARGIGIDIDPELVKSSNDEARRQGLDNRVRFRHENALTARVGDATVVTLYLLPELLHALRDRLYTELRPGARVVSHDFSFIDWMPDRKITMDVAEKYQKLGAWQSTIFLWIVPAKVGGRWHAAVSAPGGENLELSFTQKFQRIEGHAVYGSERIRLQDGGLEGNRIRFALPETRAGRKALRVFTGTVNGETMTGTVVAEHGSAQWTATRFGTPVQTRQ